MNKSISIGGSIMPPACRNLFIENTKSTFKNRFNYREGPLDSRAFSRVKSRASRPVGFKPETLPLRVASSTTPPITHLCLY